MCIYENFLYFFFNNFNVYIQNVFGLFFAWGGLYVSVFNLKPGLCIRSRFLACDLACVSATYAHGYRFFFGPLLNSILLFFPTLISRLSTFVPPLRSSMLASTSHLLPLPITPLAVSSQALAKTKVIPSTPPIQRRAAWLFEIARVTMAYINYSHACVTVDRADID